MKVAVLSVALLFTILLCTLEDAQAFPGTLLEASGGSLLHEGLKLGRVKRAAVGVTSSAAPHPPSHGHETPGHPGVPQNMPVCPSTLPCTPCSPTEHPCSPVFSQGCPIAQGSHCIPFHPITTHYSPVHPRIPQDTAPSPGPPLLSVPHHTSSRTPFSLESPSPRTPLLSPASQCTQVCPSPNLSPQLPLSVRVDDVLQQKHQVPDLPDAEVLVHPSPPLLVSSIRASPAPQRVLGGQNVDLEANRGDCPCPVSQATLDRAAPMTFVAPSGALRTQRVTVQARLGLWGLTDPKDHPEGWAGFWEM
ncbi:uncharacterized protein [Patagioenas fasciata]|uniref:uncharacterized protein isoform X1 n=1 Tax=Patagioenas fasciata TaxID=372321 RepID=UPI003A98E57E